MTLSLALGIYVYGALVSVLACYMRAGVPPSGGQAVAVAFLWPVILPATILSHAF